MFEETVKTKDGNEKKIIANSQEELNEGVKAAKDDQAAWTPDINDPKDGNKIVSPENTHAQSAEELSKHKDVDNASNDEVKEVRANEGKNTPVTKAPAKGGEKTTTEPSTNKAPSPEPSRSKTTVSKPSPEVKNSEK